jgi:hypothetical protein
MSEYRISWLESQTGEKRSRKFEVATEARGFVKGLRAHSGLEKISVRSLDQEGNAVRMTVSELFAAAGASND